MRRIHRQRLHQHGCQFDASTSNGVYASGDASTDASINAVDYDDTSASAYTSSHVSDVSTDAILNAGVYSSADAITGASTAACDYASTNASVCTSADAGTDTSADASANAGIQARANTSTNANTMTYADHTSLPAPSSTSGTDSDDAAMQLPRQGADKSCPPYHIKQHGVEHHDFVHMSPARRPTCGQHLTGNSRIWDTSATVTGGERGHLVNLGPSRVADMADLIDCTISGPRPCSAF